MPVKKCVAAKADEVTCGGDFNQDVSIALFDMAPKEQRDAIMKVAYGDIEPEFLGFVGFYKHLSEMIPRHFAVLDIGCAYAPQAFLFQEHRAYVGVDPSDGPRFSAPNTTHITATAGDYIRRGVFPSGPIFAICSYVPKWHDEDPRALVRNTFENVFTYYPESYKGN